ncbi:MAG: hypothetical protein IT349_12380 [Candidatus Eisenbacteria bacterium]|nr:hypothetical protein [Candidatus Eisenbacteria bacterium]
MAFRSIEEIRSGRTEAKDPPKWIQGILLRAWFLLIPMLAFSYVRDKQIEPAVAQAKKEILQERAVAENARVQTLGEATKFNLKRSQLEALSDTFAVRFGQIQSVLDSIRIIQADDFAQRRMLESERDSLLSVVSHSMGEQQTKSARLQELQVKIDALRVAIEQRETESTKLAAEARANRDLAERVLRPEQFEKITALVNGAGNYPDRDALPKRGN